MVVRDIIIVGGGASGLIAAVILARQNKEVTLLEHNEKIGRKILATGNGKCNFTNQVQEKSCYRGENPEFAWNLIKDYGVEAFLSFLDSIGIIPKEKNGYYYPYSEKASAIVDALQLELSHQKVKIKCREHVTKILPMEGGYRVVTDTYEYQARKVILACGGLAAPQLGSDGSGYSFAKDMGHRITPLFPALVGLKVADKGAQKLAGIRTKATITLLANGSIVASETGEIQFTAYGISGIPVFQISRYAAHALHTKKEVIAMLSLLPELSNETLVSYLEHQKEINAYKTVLQTLENLIDIKLAEVLLERAQIVKTTLMEQLDKRKIQNLILQIKEFKQTIKGENGYEQAQVTGGGVDTSQLSAKSLESNQLKGIYFIGELLDIDGTCGGYNLQWAFTSAYVAAMHAAND